MKKRNQENFIRLAACNNSNDSPYNKGSKSNTKVPKRGSGFHYGSDFTLSRPLKGTKKEIHPGGIWKYTKKDDMYSQLEEGNFRVSRDIKPYMCKRTKKMMRGAKTFWRFNDYKKYVDYLAILDDGEKTFYEQAARNPTDKIKLFLDIDMSRKEEQYKDVSTEEIQCFLTKVMSYLSAFLNMILIWNIYTSIDTSGMKESYHLVASYTVMQDKNKLKKLITHTKNHFETILKDPLFGTIDDGVYTKHRAIRLLENTKIGQCRKKIYKCTIETSNGSSAGITTGTSKTLSNYKHNSWSDSLVHHFTPDSVTLVDTGSLKLIAKPTVVRVATRKRKQTQITPSGDGSCSSSNKNKKLKLTMISDVNKWILTFASENGYEISGNKNDTIVTLRNLKTHKCITCDKIHESENPYLIISKAKGEIHYCCRRTKEKVKLANFDPTNAVKIDFHLIYPIQKYSVQNSASFKVDDNITEIFHINNEYVPDLTDLMETRSNLVLNSHLGSGKSTQFIIYCSELIKKNPKIRIVWIIPRILFGVELKEKIVSNKTLLETVIDEKIKQFKLYLECEGVTSKNLLLITSDRSLWRFKQHDKDTIRNSSRNSCDSGTIPKPDVVLIDEFVSVLKSIVSDESKNGRTLENQKILQYLLLNCKKSILADGFHNMGCINTLKKMGMKFQICINDFIQKRGEAIRIPKYNVFRQFMADKVLDGFNVIFSCSSKDKIAELKNTYKKSFDDNLIKKIKYVVSGGTTDFNNFDWYQNFLAHSSCMLVGHSFDDKNHFDYVFNYYNGKILSGSDFPQIITRCRFTKQRVLYYNVHQDYNVLGKPLTFEAAKKIQDDKIKYYTDLSMECGATTAAGDSNDVNKDHNSKDENKGDNSNDDNKDDSMNKRWLETPSWVKYMKTILLLEKNISMTRNLHLAKVYLTLNGFENATQDVPISTNQIMKVKKKKIQYDNIKDINRDTFEDITVKKESGDPITAMELLQYEKYSFKRYISNDSTSPKKDEHKKIFDKVWMNKNINVRCSIFNLMNLKKDTKDLLEREIIWRKTKVLADKSLLIHDSVLKILAFLGIKRDDIDWDNSKCSKEIPRSKFIDLFNSNKPLLKSFLSLTNERLIKKNKKDEEIELSNQVFSAINRVLRKSYLMAFKMSGRSRSQKEKNRKDTSSFSLVFNFKILSLLK